MNWGDNGWHNNDGGTRRRGREEEEVCDFFILVNL